MNKTNETIKERLFTLLEQLSEEETKEVLDFTEFLLKKEKIKRPEKRASSENDPILEYIGGVSQGALAKNIDNELYGGNS